MALTVTLLELRTRAKQRAHMENSGPLDDTEWDDNINANIRALYRILTQAYGPEYFKKSSNPSTTANVKTVPLPSDFFKLISIWWNDGSEVLKRLRRATEEEIERQWMGQGWRAWGSATSDDEWPKYALRAANIEFVPTPTAVYPLTFNYVGAPVKLTVDGDTFDGYGGFEEYVIWMTAADALNKEESDYTFCVNRANAIANDIMATAERDQSEPQTIQDTVGWWGE